MLALTCERAQIEDGMDILDLGCGWGSLPSGSASATRRARHGDLATRQPQREHIEAQIAAARHRQRRDRHRRRQPLRPGRATSTAILSIEMFEHMRNWKELLRRISTRLEAGYGKAFVHVFSHRSLAYRFEGTWAAERFFTGGTMPSHDLMLRFQEDLVVEDRWAVSGTHYAQNAARLARAPGRQLRARRSTSLKRHVGRREARRQLAAWRLFMISTAEIWDWQGRRRVARQSHYLSCTSPYEYAISYITWTRQGKGMNRVHAAPATCSSCPPSARLAFATTAFAEEHRRQQRRRRP